jgi:hypothetical protein
VYSLDAFWVVPHVGRDGANDSVEGVPRTLPSEVTCTLAVEMESSSNAASSHLLLLPQSTALASAPHVGGTSMSATMSEWSAR